MILYASQKCISKFLLYQDIFSYFLHFYADQILLNFKPPSLPTLCQVIFPGCTQFLVPSVSV